MAFCWTSASVLRQLARKKLCGCTVPSVYCNTQMCRMVAQCLRCTVTYAIKMNDCSVPLVDCNIHGCAERYVTSGVLWPASLAFALVWSTADYRTHRVYLTAA